MKNLFILLSALVLSITPAQIQKGSVTAYCYMEQESVEGLEVSLYKVGDMDGNSIKLSDTYIGIQSPDFKSSSELQSCAQSAYSRIKGSGYEPDFTAQADTNGIVRFADVPYGVYCAASNKYQSDNKIYSVVPVLVFVDGDTAVDLKMDVVVVTEEEKTSVTVKKKWVLSHDSKSVPVTVELLKVKDGTVVDSVELNAGNNWTYTWTDLDKDCTWTVAERRVPEGFVAELAENGNSFVITNTAIDYLKATPQTGIDISRPFGLGVLILAAIIAVIFIISYLRKERNEDENM